MGNRFYWICAILTVIVGIGMFLFIWNDMKDRKMHEKDLANAKRMLKSQQEKDVNSLLPPKGETSKTGYWRGNVWHKTESPALNDQSNDDHIESISVFSESENQLDAAERIIKESPYSDAAAEARIILLYEYMYNYNKAEILSYLEKSLEYHPESSLILSQFGRQLWEDSPQEAIPYLQKALSVSNPDGTAYLFLGHAYQRLGDYKTAWVHYTKGRRLVDMHPLDPFSEHILSIESGIPKISQINYPGDIDNEELTNDLTQHKTNDEDKSISPEISKSDDFLFIEGDSDEMNNTSLSDYQDGVRRAFTEKQKSKEFDPITIDDLSHQELDEFIEWAKTVIEGVPQNTNNFLSQELLSHFMGKETMFYPNQIARAFEYFQRHGQDEGMKILQKNDPELFKEVHRLRSSE